MMRRVCMLLLVLVLAPDLALARSVEAARADSLYSRGEREASRNWYAAAVARDPHDGPSVFFLAELTASNARAIAMIERYMALEPNEVWSHVALADRLARMGRVAPALAHCEQAARMVTKSGDVLLGRARVFSRLGDQERAERELAAWLAFYPDDVESWLERGRVAIRAGRPRRAGSFLEQARDIAYPPIDKKASRLLVSARALAVPAVEPLMSTSKDSDDNRTVMMGARADLMIADGVRLGARGEQWTVQGATERASAQSAALELTMRPRSTLRLTASGGVMRLQPNGASVRSTTGTGSLRTSWRALGNGATAELRAQRTPLVATPELIANEVVRDELQLALELPVAALRVRALGRAANVASSFDRNTRSGGEARVTLPLGAFSPWARVQQMRYAHATTAGYFAPARAEATALGASIAAGDGAPWTLELEAGAGPQRYTPQSGVPGAWRMGADGYGYVSAALAPGRELRVEVEASDSPGLSPTAAVGANWRYWSLAASLRWGW